MTIENPEANREPYTTMTLGKVGPFDLRYEHKISQLGADGGTRERAAVYCFSEETPIGMDLRLGENPDYVLRWPTLLSGDDAVDVIRAVSKRLGGRKRWYESHTVYLDDLEACDSREGKTLEEALLPTDHLSLLRVDSEKAALIWEVTHVPSVQSTPSELAWQALPPEFAWISDRPIDRGYIRETVENTIHPDFINTTGFTLQILHTIFNKYRKAKDLTPEYIASIDPLR
jgi:hypothetical protein